MPLPSRDTRNPATGAGRAFAWNALVSALQLSRLALDAAFCALDALDRVQLAALDRCNHRLQHRDQLTLVANRDRALVRPWAKRLCWRIAGSDSKCLTHPSP